MNEKIRLQKLLANAGLASRRKIEEYIAEERIKVNGVVSKIGDKAGVDDEIEFDNQPVPLNPDLQYFLLNKPLGVLSSSSDDRGRKTVVDLIDTNSRIFPVGRLDINTTGLIILTNDGDLTYKITHPKHSVDKTYIVRASGHIQSKSIELLESGVELEDGITAKSKVKVLARNSKDTLLEITIHEGRNRQIRRMCSAIGHEVISLMRTRIGPIKDPKLQIGQYRKLSLAEVHELYQACEGSIN